MHLAGIKGLTLSTSERRHSAERQQPTCVGWEATGIDRFATLFRLRFDYPAWGNHCQRRPRDPETAVSV